ncbi:MAG: hypothetical protein AB9869_17335 [Verrucomicrobiia bacterium]
MRLRRLALVGGWLVLLLILSIVTLSFVSVRQMGASIGVHSYQREGDEVSACLALTNTGAVSLAVPLRFACQVHMVSGLTNYLVDTRYTVFLQPRDYVILSNALWRVRLPSDTRTWGVAVRVRQMSGRERFVDALRKSGLVEPRILSKLAAGPRKDSDYQWLECGSSLLKVADGP